MHTQCKYGNNLEHTHHTLTAKEGDGENALM